jgi:signal transduction histidine kinase
MDLVQLGPAGLTQDQFLLIEQAVNDADDISRFLERTLSADQSSGPEPNKCLIDWAKVFEQLQRMTGLMNLAYSQVASLSFHNTFEGMILLDERLLQRAVINLVTHSFRAMHQLQMAPEEGRLELSARAEGPWLTLTLSDNAAQRADVPEQAARLQREICRQIVEEVHGGQMSKPALDAAGNSVLVLRLPLG